MKTYEPRRNNACPNGLHPDYDPQKDPSQNECTCPWLIIQSSTPVQHLTSWNRRELDNAIREFDNGYFDPPGYPRRERSMFLSPTMQRLLDVAEKEPVAAALTLLAGSGSGLPPFDAITWSAVDACLSLRTAPLSWMQLWLGHTNTEAITDSAAQMPGGADPVLLWADHPDTYAEVNLRRYGAASVSVLPDVYAEGEENLAECQRNGTCCGTCNADFGTCCTHEPSPIKTTPAQVIAMAQDAADVAANSTTARIMGDYMPLILTVPADEIPNMKPGHPIYDQAVAAVESLPQRVPQVPSDIAEAGNGDYCTCDLNLRYTCPTCRAAQERSYEPQPPLCLDDEPDGLAVCQMPDGHEGLHRSGEMFWSGF